MILTTTHSIEGRAINKYLGLVCGSAILGANIFKDFFMGVRNIVGGRVNAYEQKVEQAREIAFEEVSARARDLGADAVVGIHIGYEVLGGDTGHMLMVSVSGTAIALQ